jgi:hypothetical protein
MSRSAIRPSPVRFPYPRAHLDHAPGTVAERCPNHWHHIRARTFDAAAHTRAAHTRIGHDLCRACRVVERPPAGSGAPRPRRRGTRRQSRFRADASAIRLPHPERRRGAARCQVGRRAAASGRMSDRKRWYEPEARMRINPDIKRHADELPVEARSPAKSETTQISIHPTDRG